MPWASQAQRAFMYAKHPKIAAKIQGETPKGKKLPKKVAAAASARRDSGKKRRRRPDGRFG
jgi:hypothetical protein